MMNEATNDGQETRTSFVPRTPSSVEDTGLSLAFLTDLAIKTMYLEGNILGYELAEHMRLPHAGVVEDLRDLRERIDTILEAIAIQAGREKTPGQ